MGGIMLNILQCVFTLLNSSSDLLSPSSSMIKEPLIIDTDPGIDDAVALFVALADPRLDVQALTVVQGNAEINNTFINAMKILIVAGRNDVPVYKGAGHGLLDEHSTDNYFGDDGLRDGSWTVQPNVEQQKKEHAAVYLAQAVKNNPGKISVLALGPLTNIALAIHLNPSFLRQVKRLVILGGSNTGQGNRSPGVEFNMYSDPHAAAFVFENAISSNILITQIPMETVTKSDLSKEWRWNTLAKLDNDVVHFMNKIETEQDREWPEDYYHPYDIFAVSAVLDKRDIVEKRETVNAFVETVGQRSRGSLLIDYSRITKNPANLDVITAVNIENVKKLMMDNLSSYSRR